MNLKIVFLNGETIEISDVLSIDCLTEAFLVYYTIDDDVVHNCFNREKIKYFHLQNN